MTRLWVALLLLAFGLAATPVPAAATGTPAPQPLVTSPYERVRDELLDLLARKGVSAALTELGRRSSREPKVAGVCHAIAHDLGHAALMAAAGRISEVLGERDDVCGGGFTHGAIELALGASKNPARDLLTICAPTQDGSCFHGVGHGLMFATGMDVEKSLALCDRAPRRTLSIRCGEGVFMQLFSADVAGGHMGGAGATHHSTDDAARTCARTRSSYQETCWFYSPTVWLGLHPEDFSGALRWCEAQGRGLAMCTKGLGSRTIKYHPEDPRIGARICRTARDVDSCLSGMGSYWSVHWSGERAPRDVCSRLGDSTLERRCRAVT